MNALPVWDLLWILRFSRREKHFPHKAQRWGFSLVWVRMWISILYLKKKDILLYKCPQNKKASHKVFMLNRWCLLLTNHYTRNPIYGNICWITSSKIFKRSQTTWRHYISLWAITAFENWKRNNDDKFFSISLSLFSKSKRFVWNAVIKDIYRKLP